MILIRLGKLGKYQIVTIRTNNTSETLNQKDDFVINHISVCYSDNSPSLVNGTEKEKIKIINRQIFYINVLEILRLAREIKTGISS